MDDDRLLTSIAFQGGGAGSRRDGSRRLAPLLVGLSRRVQPYRARAEASIRQANASQMFACRQ